ncbi:MAG TPA: YjfB family protein [Rhodocyclaceae bacterium]|nr:YjfB family protein [Rhodocyclaceae bacterium]
MDVSAAANTYSAMTHGNVKAQASLLVQRKAMDIQEGHAQQLLNALPRTPAVDPAATMGGRINTFA